MICSQCGKEFTVLYPELWAYKAKNKWFCTWKCLRKDEKGENDMRMKKDGTPAAKPGRKPKINKDWEKYGKQKEDEKGNKTVFVPEDAQPGEGPVKYYERQLKEAERDLKELENEDQGDKGWERYVPEVEKPEKTITLNDENATPPVIEPEGPMTDEERKEKYPLIATRIESTNGTWEMVGPYKAGETLLGYKTRTDRSYEWLPLETAKKLILTVDEWYKLFEELDQVVIMMKL